MAFSVIGIHAGVLVDVNWNCAFITIQVFARMAVPFFFIASGFFYAKGLVRRWPDGDLYLRSYEKKLLGLFAFWAAVMLGFWIKSRVPQFGWTWLLLGKMLQTLVFDPGVFWYLEALMAAALISYYFIKHDKYWMLLVLASVCYVFGMFGDSYYGLIKDSPVIGGIYRWYFSVFVHARHGLPFGLLFFSIGALFARHEAGIDIRLQQQSRATATASPDSVARNALAGRWSLLCALFCCALFLRYEELLAVNSRGLALDNSISLGVIPPSVLLFIIAYNCRLSIEDGTSRKLRTLSSTVFFSHQFMLELIILFVELSGIQIGNTPRFLIAALLCVGLFFAVEAGKSPFLKRMING